MVRPLGRRRPVDGVGAVGAAARAAGRALPRRQLAARPDGPLGGGPHQPGPPAAHELVAVPRARLTAVPALPEPALHAVGRHRDVRRPGHGVPLVPLPAARPVADHRLLERPALRPEPLDRGVGRGGGALPRLGRRHRLRDQGLRLGRLRRVDAAVGGVDAPAGVGVHLPGADRAAGALGVLRRPLHHVDGRAALRDGLPRLRAAPRVALPGAVGPVAATRACRGTGRGGRAGVGLGHRPRAGAVALGGAQPGPGGHAARERVRRPPDAVRGW